MSLVFKASFKSSVTPEIGSFTPTYTRATGAWYIDENGSLQSVSSGVSRHRSDLGFLREPQSTNLVPYDRDFSQWTASGSMTVTGSDGDGPRGAGTMTLLSAGAANQTIIYDLGTIASYEGTFSIWLKRKTGSGNIQLTRDGGATWTTVSVTAQATRLRIRQTLADPDVGVRIVTSGDEVWCDMAQDEDQYDYTSNILTNGSTVTRNADKLTYPSSGLPTGTLTLGALVTMSRDLTSYPGGITIYWVGSHDAGNGVSLAVFYSSGRLQAQVYDGTSRTANLITDAAVDDIVEGGQKMIALTTTNADHRSFSSYTQRQTDADGASCSGYDTNWAIGQYGSDSAYDTSSMSTWIKNLFFDDSILTTQQMKAILEPSIGRYPTIGGGQNPFRRRAA